MAGWAPLAVLLLSPGVALAGDVDKTIAQKNEWAERAEMLDEKARAVKDACGATLTAAFDKASYPEFDPMQDRTEAHCRDVLNTLVALCKSPAGKEGVAKVKQVSCKHSTTGTKVELRGDTLQVSIGPQKTGIVGLKKGSYSWKSALEGIL